MEYAICTESASSQFNELENCRKEQLELHCKQKRNTTSAMLSEICNAKSMYVKLMEQQIKFWHKCKRCPNN